MDIQKIGTGSPAAISVAPSPEPAQTAAASKASAAPPVSAVAIKPAAPKAVSQEDVNQALKDINQAMKADARGLEFAVSENDRQVLVKVVDTKTKEVLTQIPSKAAIEISKELGKLQGLLIKEKV